MHEEQMERDKYKERIDIRFHNPAVTAECLDQYDGKVAARRMLSEYTHSIEAQVQLYRQLLAAHREDAKRVEEAVKTAEYATRECERVTLAFKELREHYAAALKEVEDLQMRNDSLVRAKVDIEDRYKELEVRYVDAVNSGKQMLDKYDAVVSENKILDNKVRHLQEQIMLGNKDRVGATTEKTSKLFAGDLAEGVTLNEDIPASGESGEVCEPAEADVQKDMGEEAASSQDIEQMDGADMDGQSDDSCYDKSPDYSSQRMLEMIWDMLTGDGKDGQREGKGRKDRKPKSGKKKEWKRSEIYDHIEDHVNVYNYDFCELDRTYAGKKWRIVGYHEKKTVCETRPHNYVKHEFTPVIAVKNDDGTETIVSERAESDIYPHSFASDSIISSLVIKRYDMSLPLYRIEREYSSRGIPLSRKTMCNWLIHFGLDVFGPVYDRMWDWLKDHCTIQQCDETTWRIIIWPYEEDPTRRKANGSKGYVWVHTSSELTNGHKVILYSFEKSRSADHLRRWISNLVLYLVSDAYSAYGTIEKEHEGTLSVCNCWMHCRRAWAKAVYVMEPGLNDMSVEELAKRPEVQGLLLTNAIFEADTPLKTLGTEERRRRRLELVAPLVDKFFKFVHSIDLEDPSVDGKLREAVIYSLNQEKRLKVFLEDGSIPIDNGYVERCIRPIALSRRNSLFSYSVFGAECSMILYTLVETAKANGADPYVYIKYLVNELPKYLDGTDRSFLDDMMPWAEKYQAYEREQRRLHADERVPESSAPPKRCKMAS